MSERMNKKACIGCEQNFYNGNNPYGIKECWNFKDAKIITRYSISVNAPMGTRANYSKEKRPDCYSAKRICYLKAIPEYAR